ncbi:hypothetical protein ACFQ0Q_34115 [Streptomyces aureus]
MTLVPVLDAPALPLGLAWRADDTDPAVAALVDLVDKFADGLRDLPAT